MSELTLILQVEFKQILRDRSFLLFMLLLIALMACAIWYSNGKLVEKRQEIEVQRTLVQKNDHDLAAQIDSLNNNLADYSDSYTLPTNGVRLTYNNHRITYLPINPMAVLSIGQSDIYSNYKKIILYFNDSYEMNTEELISPIEQLFGQLDLSFVWTYLLPLIIVLVSFNILSEERETGRLPLIYSNPVNVSRWLIVKIFVRLVFVFGVVLITTLVLLSIFGVSLPAITSKLLKLALVLFLYSTFWFLLSFVINLAGFSSGKSLIVLTGCWVLFVFLIPSIINQVSKELHHIPARLELVNHHQQMYNQMESNLEVEKEALFDVHPNWKSDDPVTKDISNSTGWNIDYLAKQYIAQLKHQPKVEEYEAQIDERNEWLLKIRVISPTMIFQETISSLAGTSTDHYRSYLRQSKEYAQNYRVQVFKGLFTNHAFTSTEILELPKFEFDESQVKTSTSYETAILFLYLLLLSSISIILQKKN